LRCGRLAVARVLRVQKKMEQRVCVCGCVTCDQLIADETVFRYGCGTDEVGVMRHACHMSHTQHLWEGVFLNPFEKDKQNPKTVRNNNKMRPRDVCLTCDGSRIRNSQQQQQQAEAAALPLLAAALRHPLHSPSPTQRFPPSHSPPHPSLKQPRTSLSLPSLPKPHGKCGGGAQGLGHFLRKPRGVGKTRNREQLRGVPGFFRHFPPQAPLPLLRACVL